jgi:predicted nucleic acid-binding protein
MKVLIDTSAFVSLLVENEQSHKKVVEQYKNYRQQRAIFFTSFYILDELFTRLLYFKLFDIKSSIQTIFKSIHNQELTNLEITETLFEKSTHVFIKFAEHKISFTDATSFTLYKEFNLDEIFTLDSDFKKIGATTSL